MAHRLHRLFDQYARPRLLAALHALAGQPPGILVDEARYRAQVLDAAWRDLPLPLRMLGRKRLHWDELLLALRPQVFDAQGGKVTVRPDAEARLDALVRQHFGAAEARIAPAPVVPPVKAPVQSPPAPAAPALGIDLGTTYSVIAHLDAQGRPWSIPNAHGEILTPSVLLLEDDGPVVGKQAVQSSVLKPERVADCVKRDMGAPAYRRLVHGEHYPPEVLASFILRSLKADAQRRLGAVGPAVITVPAYFDEPRRRATVDAGRLAGLDVLDILNEPTAAALAYGYQLGFLGRHGQGPADRPLRVLVYDLGGGTFDVTIIEIQGRAFRALATDGDVGLGGKDWDEKLVEIAAERIRRQYREDPRSNPVGEQALWLAAETAKRVLSERPSAPLVVNLLGSPMRVEVTRAEFEDATAPLLGRTRTTTEIVIRQAGLRWQDIDRVLLVGGSTRMPMVAQMLQDVTGKVPERSVSPDEAVAHGAALYADLILHSRGLRPGPAPFSVTNINSHSLRLVGVDPKTGRKRTRQLIPKNTPLPHTATQEFKTHKAGQKNVVIRIVEGESERPEACSPVGACAIRALPRDLPAGWPVQVSYTYEPNGRLCVGARLKGHAAAVTTEFVRINSLPDSDLDLWAECVGDDGS